MLSFSGTPVHAVIGNSITTPSPSLDPYGSPNSTPKCAGFPLPFTKMQGLGNDFVVIDSLGRGAGASVSDEGLNHLLFTPDMAKAICERRFGVGADQVLWLKKPHDPSLDARMEILNADGSIAEMCGNGIRAVAVFLRNKLALHKADQIQRFQIETLAGIKTVEIQNNQVQVDMGVPVLGTGVYTDGERIEAGGRELSFFEVNVGNPHAVFFVEDVAQFPVKELGPILECHPRFPKRTNVEFVQVLSSGAIRVRVWERGAGITLACGTGACASAIASLATKRVQGEVDVQLPGGGLSIRWDGPTSSVMMAGPAKEVFRGVFIFD